MFALHCSRMTSAPQPKVIRLKSLIEAGEKYLVVFSDSTSCFPKKDALPFQVFTRFPYANIYHRRLGNIEEHSDKPGTMSISGDGSKEARFVVNFIVQSNANDTSKQRFEWFKQALTELEQMHLTDVPSTYAFPYRVEGLWKDKYWTTYEQELDEFNKTIQFITAQTEPAVVMYHNPPPKKPVLKSINKKQQTISSMSCWKKRE